MNVRLGLALAAAVVFAGTGCASGGAAGPSGSAEAPVAAGERLEVGVRPRDNEHTRSAELYLTQALSAEEEAQARTRFEQALQASLAGITADPGNPKSFYQAGQAYVGLNDFVGADSMLTRAEELHPVYELESVQWRERGWVEAYNQAITPLNEGNLERAVELFEQADALYSARPEALLQLGSLYSRMDRPEDAVEAFRKAAEMLEGTREEQLADTAGAEIWEQHWQIATLGLGQSYMLAEMYPEAADHFGSLLAEDPGNVEIMGNLAGVLSQLGQADSVQALYDNLLNRADLSERDLFNAGVGLYQIENYGKAGEAFQKAADMNPFNRDARLNLAQTYYAAEMWNELIPAAREVLKVDPRNSLVWIFLTRALSETEQTEEANAVFQEFEAIGYEVQNLRLEPGANGGAVIYGEVKNTSLEPGTTVTLRFHFGGPEGQEIGTVDVRVQAPEAEGVRAFQGELQSSQPVTGYTYEVIAP